VLVRTGKYTEKDEEGDGDDRPRHVVDSIADLPRLLGLG
jgi:ribonucleotide monophosphatase NagD (HAD superfamily)